MDSKALITNYQMITQVSKDFYRMHIIGMILRIIFIYVLFVLKDEEREKQIHSRMYIGN